MHVNDTYKTLLAIVEMRLTTIEHCRMYGATGPMATAMLVIGLASALAAAATMIRLVCPGCKWTKACRRNTDLDIE